ncbi:MAG: MerR family transcriptional regulator [Thermoleophilia bacterium]|nr:MerR family transcriptional regulator [Thermoleophilia bacterium]
MRVGELAKAAGVTVQTIHFYLREGLLPPPVKTAPNMAYYGPEYLEEIRLIKELQSDRYLPLGLISQLLQAKREGHDVGQLREMRLALDWAFSDGDGQAEGAPMTLPDYIVHTGLSLDQIKKLEDLGLITMGTVATETADSEAAKPYDALDQRLGRAVKTLLDHGLATDDLELYQRQLALCREESALVHEKMFRDRPRSIPRISTQKLLETLGELQTVLTLRATRLVAAEVPKQPHEPGGR